MFKLLISDTVKPRIKGVMPDPETGRDVPFDFVLICQRSSATQLREAAATSSGMPLSEFMASKVEGWELVLDQDRNPVDFTPERAADLLDIPGMASLAFDAYMEACSAKGKEKNSSRP